MPVMQTVIRTILDEEGKKVGQEPLKMYSVDAREAVRNHPAEYAFEQKPKPKAAPEPKSADADVLAALRENSEKQAKEIEDLKAKLADGNVKTPDPKSKDSDDKSQK